MGAAGDVPLCLRGYVTGSNTRYREVQADDIARVPGAGLVDEEPDSLAGVDPTCDTLVHLSAVDAVGHVAEIAGSGGQ